MSIIHKVIYKSKTEKYTRTFKETEMENVPANGFVKLATTHIETTVKDRKVKIEVKSDVNVENHLPSESYRSVTEEIDLAVAEAVDHSNSDSKKDLQIKIKSKEFIEDSKESLLIQETNTSGNESNKLFLKVKPQQETENEENITLQSLHVKSEVMENKFKITSSVKNPPEKTDSKLPETIVTTEVAKDPEPKEENQSGSSTKDSKKSIVTGTIQNGTIIINNSRLLTKSDEILEKERQIKYLREQFPHFNSMVLHDVLSKFNFDVDVAVTELSKTNKSSSSVNYAEWTAQFGASPSPAVVTKAQSDSSSQTHTKKRINSENTNQASKQSKAKKKRPSTEQKDTTRKRAKLNKTRSVSPPITDRVTRNSSKQKESREEVLKQEEVTKSNDTSETNKNTKDDSEKGNGERIAQSTKHEKKNKNKEDVKKANQSTTSSDYEDNHFSDISDTTVDFNDNNSDSENSFEEIRSQPSPTIIDELMVDRNQLKKFFQTACTSDLQFVVSFSKKNVDAIIACRPFKNWIDLVQKLQDNKDLGIDVLNTARQLLMTHSNIKALLKSLEDLAEQVGKAVNAENEIREQPKTLFFPEGRGKSEIIALNWLAAVHKQNINGILINKDEMSKKVQVIAFLAHLKEIQATKFGVPHLMVVPSPKIDSWQLEFERFCPAFKVFLYHGSKEDRRRYRNEWYKGDISNYDIILATYSSVISTPEEMKMFRIMQMNYVIFDNDALTFKNFTTQRYENLMKIKATKRLLLMESPFQNDLLELMSLLKFVAPFEFTAVSEELAAFFEDCVSSGREEDDLSTFEKEEIELASKILNTFILQEPLQKEKEQLVSKGVDYVIESIIKEISRYQLPIILAFHQLTSEPRVYLDQRCLQKALEDIRDPQSLASGHASSSGIKQQHERLREKEESSTRKYPTKSFEGSTSSRFITNNKTLDDIDKEIEACLVNYNRNSSGVVRNVAKRGRDWRGGNVTQREGETSEVAVSQGALGNINLSEVGRGRGRSARGRGAGGGRGKRKGRGGITSGKRRAARSSSSDSDEILKYVKQRSMTEVLQQSKMVEQKKGTKQASSSQLKIYTARKQSLEASSGEEDNISTRERLGLHVGQSTKKSKKTKEKSHAGTTSTKSKKKSQEVEISNKKSKRNSSEAEITRRVSEIKRGRGRPFGSTSSRNKPEKQVLKVKPTVVKESSNSPKTARGLGSKKRGPGRPKANIKESDFHFHVENVYSEKDNSRINVENSGLQKDEESNIINSRRTTFTDTESRSDADALNLESRIDDASIIEDPLEVSELDNLITETLEDVKANINLLDIKTEIGEIVIKQEPFDFNQGLVKVEQNEKISQSGVNFHKMDYTENYPSIKQEEEDRKPSPKQLHSFKQIANKETSTTSPDKPNNSISLPNNAGNWFSKIIEDSLRKIPRMLAETVSVRNLKEADVIVLSDSSSGDPFSNLSSVQYNTTSNDLAEEQGEHPNSSSYQKTSFTGLLPDSDEITPSSSRNKAESGCLTVATGAHWQSSEGDTAAGVSNNISSQILES